MTATLATPVSDAPKATETPVTVTSRHFRSSTVMGDLDRDVVLHLHWCEQLRGLRASTIRSRRDVLSRLGHVIDRPLRDAQIGHILAWEQQVVAGLSPNTRKTYVNHVAAFFRWAVAAGVVTDDPSVMLTRPKTPSPLPRPINEDDLTLALAAASPKMAAMMTLMAYAGLRCMEVAQLQWSDMEMAGDQAWLTVRDGKGGKDRQVPLSGTVMRSLRRYGMKGRGTVFLGLNGKQIKATSVSKGINEHLARLAIPYTAHKLRARFATQAAAVVDTVLVAELCGWESLQTARHYIKPDRERSAQLVAALDKLAQAN